MKENTQPLTNVEWDTCWMAVRYAMGRRTAASASLPRKLLRAYYHRWTDAQKLQIARDLKEFMGDFGVFGDETIDHPEWVRFLMTLDFPSHLHANLKDGSMIAVFDYEGMYYPLDWWTGQGVKYVSKESIIRMA